MKNFCSYLTYFDEYRLPGESIEDHYRTDLIRKEILGQGAGHSGTDIHEDFAQVFKGVMENDWYALKKPIFNLYPGVDNALLSTKINIPTSELNFPFSTFAIQLHTDSEIYLDSHRGREKLCSILVHTEMGKLLGPRVMAPTGDPNDTLTISCVLDIFREGERARRPFDLILNKNNTVYQSIKNITDEGLALMTEIAAGLGHTFYGTEDIDESDFIRRGKNSQILAKLIIGTAFLAISKDRRYVQKKVIKIRGNEQCFCGSGKKYKKCCKLKGIQNVGYDIGKGIYLPTHQTSGEYEVAVERGKELQWSHIRSGHMRWQTYKVCACGSGEPFKECCKKPGEWTRKLIFIHPNIIRPDLSLKPQLTPRFIKKPRPNPHYETNYGWDDDYCPDCGCRNCW